METKIGFIGLGEAGTVIAKGLVAEGGGPLTAYDIALEDPATRPDLENRAARAGVALCPDLRSLADCCNVLVSAVVGAVAVDVARRASAHLGPEHFYLDLNSVSPETKRQIGAVVEASGARFVEAAVMTNVPRAGHGVPMLLCGDAAPQLISMLAPLGMNLTDFGREIGRASAAKMFRSLVVKGLEALLLECVMSASRYGVAREVLEYVGSGYPGLDWNALADNLLTRTALHGTRRAHELDEVADTLKAMGIEPFMARAGAARLKQAAGTGIEERFAKAPPSGYAEVVAAIEAAGSEKNRRED